jgi:hypothetical protein
MNITNVIDVNQVAVNMFKAISNSLNTDITDSVNFGTVAIKNYITNIDQILADATTGAISQEEAHELMENAAISLQIAGETQLGLAKITVQNAINAAIDVLNAAIGAAIGAVIKIPPIPIP